MAQEHRSRAMSFWRGVVRLWRFDLRRFRVLAAIVVALEVLRAALAEWVLQRGPLLPGQINPWADTTAFEFLALDGALWLTTAITTAIVIQADHPTDDRGFLRSQPVGPWTLAIAKLTLLGTLFVVLPLAATAARLFAYGAPMASITASAVQFVVIGSAVVLPAWTLALLTRTLPRFLAAAAGVAIAWYVSMAAISSLVPLQLIDLVIRVHDRAIEAFSPPLTDWQRVDGRGWLFALAMTGAAATLVLSAYRPRRAKVATLAGIALVTVAALLPARESLRSPAADLARQVDGRVTLPALVIPIALDMRSARGEGPSEWIFGAVTLPALPSNVSVERTLGVVHVSAPGLDVSVPSGSLHRRDQQDFERAGAAAAGTTYPGWRSLEDDILFSLARADAEAILGRRVDVEAPIDLRFTRHVLVADLPLRAGVTFRSSDYLFEVLAVDLRWKGGVSCRVTRFPSLTRRYVGISTFVGNPATRIVQTSGASLSEDTVAGVGWAHGRTWSREMHLSLLELGEDPIALPLRLRIVEARPDGEMRTTLTARDVPVRPRQPRPPSPPTQMPKRLD
jgi:hypothetical protein